MVFSDLPQSDSPAHRPRDASLPKTRLPVQTSLLGMEISAETQSITDILLQGFFFSPREGENCCFACCRHTMHLALAHHFKRSPGLFWCLPSKHRAVGFWNKKKREKKLKQICEYHIFCKFDQIKIHYTERVGSVVLVPKFILLSYTEHLTVFTSSIVRALHSWFSLCAPNKNVTGEMKCSTSHSYIKPERLTVRLKEVNGLITIKVKG